MIQRIQSIYFLLASIFQILFSYVTLITFTSPVGAETYSVSGIYNPEGVLIAEDYKNLVLCLINATLIFVTIFLFKNRTRQMKMAKVFVLIGLVQVSFLIMKFINLHGHQDVTDVSLSLGVVFLPLAIAFGYIGGKYVKKDNDLVKSVDRIR